MSDNLFDSEDAKELKKRHKKKVDIFIEAVILLFVFIVVVRMAFFSYDPSDLVIFALLLLVADKAVGEIVNYDDHHNNR